MYVTWKKSTPTRSQRKSRPILTMTKKSTYFTKIHSNPACLHTFGCKENVEKLRSKKTTSLQDLKNVTNTLKVEVIPVFSTSLR